MPKIEVPFRYFMTCFAASMWPGEGLHWCLARIDVITDMSGRVPVANQLRDPTNLLRYD